ncbi:MAG: DUF4167 domain-containing protein [Shimia sp.]|jgi:hypothetical protein|uniref:DUF4167 domain-containing protein n=1 Tax=Shimia sp. TaxID=1954381 RepID=UPI0040587CD3
MRSSKSRSRNKSNRNRPSGNIVNRVFDSSGPEGKVRGTPQQVIDKYNQLARDSQLGNDRVATENFQQHAEHYQRMLNEAQREQDARREEQERQNRERQADRDRERRDRIERQEREANGNNEQPAAVPVAPADPSEAEQPDLVMGNDVDSGLVDTPETMSEAPKAAPAAAPKKPRKRSPRKKPVDTAEAAPETPPSEETPAAE